MRAFSHYPVPAMKAEPLEDSYYREFMPGTQQEYAREYHYGIDIGAPKGKAVVTPDVGRVVAVGNIWGTAYGFHQVLMLHTASLGTQRWYTFYAHMEDCHVRVGEAIPSGGVIGNIGAEGNAFGPHLHMELHVKGYWSGVVDPAPPVITPSRLYTMLEAIRRR